jgi:antitoxin VapB
MNHVSDIIPPYLVNTLADSPTRNVSLFRNGANQAVRIPKEFELPGKQATMRRVGNRLIIEAVAALPAKGTVAALVAALESMKDWSVVTEPFPDVDEGLLPLDDIVL